MARRARGSLAPPGVDPALQVDESQWFGPLEPLAPMAPKEVTGRRFDIRPGYNLVTQPRGETRVSFRELRALADNYDVLRLVIETRKDQMAKLTWSIRNKDEGKRKATDPRVKEVTDFLARPDREHNWETWLRALEEEKHVIDAATIYPRRDLSGKLYSLDLIDGATIKPVIDDHGRRPVPPAPAYQQVLVGLPAVDYSSDELYYFPRNYRPAYVYGFSAVEQIIMTVNVALRRQLHQLEYYTAGTMPDALIGVPDTWSPPQIEEFQAYFDALLTDNTAERRKVRFVPAGISKGFVQTKEAALKDDTDEWLARIVSYAFSISPQWAVKAMNRATAETAQKASLQEGLAPEQQWVKGVLDHSIAAAFGYPDLEFAWDEEDEIDPETKAGILDGQLARGAITIDEQRAELGREPLPDGLGAKPLVYTASGAVLLESIVNPPEPAPAAPGAAPGAPPAKLPPELSAAEARGTPMQKAAGAKGEQALQQIWQKLLAAEGKRIAAAVRKGKRMRKAGGGDEGDEPIDLDPDAWEAAEAASRAELERLALAAAAEGGAAIGLSDDDVTKLANPRAVEWAKERAGELVSQVSDTTRTQINAIVAQGEDEGWSVAQTASAIESAAAFSPARALRIAHTETRGADNHGALSAWQGAKAAGVEVKKRWITRGDNVCEECQSNEADGAIDVDDSFNSGDDAPPAHPGCECDVEPVLDKE